MPLCFLHPYECEREGGSFTELQFESGRLVRKTLSGGKNKTDKGDKRSVCFFIAPRAYQASFEM